MSRGAGLEAALAALAAGEPIGFPTETVYGLGADARSERGVGRVFELKGRPPGHPLIVHAASAEAALGWAARVPDVARRLAERFWPGPLTLILPKAPGTLPALTGDSPGIGLRVPAHPLALRLLEAFGGGIAAPSANRFGRVSPTTAGHVREEFGSTVPVVLDGGPCEVGLESTIISCLDELLVLRPGGTPVAALEALVGPLRRAARGEGPRAPGTLAQHYAPRTPLTLAAGSEFERASRAAGVAVLALGPAPAAATGAWIGAGRDPARYGHELYANLRALDQLGARAILVEAVPVGPEWEAVRDRLARAAACEAEELA